MNFRDKKNFYPLFSQLKSSKWEWCTDSIKSFPFGKSLVMTVKVWLIRVRGSSVSEGTIPVYLCISVRNSNVTVWGLR